MFGANCELAICWCFSWDETHFGKMGSYYINRTFFFDVHPPLGKVRSQIISSLWKPYYSTVPY